MSHLQLPLSWRVGSGFPSRWQVGWRLVHSSSEAWVLHSTARQGVVILNGLRRLYRILIPFQFELNEITPLTTHSNYCIETFLYKDFTLVAFTLERRGIFTKDLSRVSERSVVKYNEAGI
jgi:hypothetical protein